MHPTKTMKAEAKEIGKRALICNYETLKTENGHALGKTNW